MLTSKQVEFTGEDGDYRYIINIVAFSDECELVLRNVARSQTLDISLGDIPHLRQILDEFETLKKETNLEV